MTITYRYNDWTIAGIMQVGVPSDFDAAGIIAQRYMSQFPAIVAAQVSNGEIERTISRTTAWQKANG